MKLKLGEKYLITTDGWFLAPDGETYRAVFGTVEAVDSAEETLQIKTNYRSTNWYVVIGNMIIAGCQIHYCIRSDKCSFEPPMKEIEHKGKLIVVKEAVSNIYNADGNDFND